MSVRLLDLATCTCTVIAPGPVHEAMRHYVYPYLVPALRQPGTVLTVSCDASAVASAGRVLASRTPATMRASHPQQRYRVWATGSRHVLLPEHTPDHVITVSGSHLSLTATQPQVAATIGTRIVRQLIMRGGETLGGRCAHAGAVDIGGDGVLVGGHSGTGKTSVLTHLIERHGARPVANDRTVLVPLGGGLWRLIGVPLAWRFTPEGISGSMALSAALANHEPSRGRHLVDGKTELTPWEVSRALGRPALPEARAARLIILMRSPGRPPARPDGVFARQHLDFGAADFFAEDWLGIRPHLPGPHNQFPADSEALWGELAGTVPGQVLSWTDPAELPAIAAAVAEGSRP